MGRPDQASVSRERKLRALIDFAAELRSNLPKTDSSQPNDLIIADIKHHSANAATLAQDTSAQSTSRATAKSVESQGRELWNLCIRLKRVDAQADAKVLTWVRVLAFALLCLGRSSGRQRQDAESEVVYLMTNALTLARLCMGANELEPATGALHKAAELLDRLKEITSGQPIEKGRVRLEAEYHAMRMALSWRDDRLDVAEHMFSKTEVLRPHLDAASAEMMADTLRHIGTDLFSKSDYQLAVKWLKRAYDIITSQDPEHVSAQGLQNRIAICHAFVQSLLRIGTPESLHNADSLVAYFESSIGDKPVVLHWRLEILQSYPGEVFDADKYSSILRRMVRTFDSCDESFNFLLHHIKELRNKNSRLAIALIDEFLISRILESNNAEWLNKVVITRIWMSTMDMDSAETHQRREALSDLMDTVSDSVLEPLSPDAAGAAHSLIWKKVEAAVANQQHDDADAWCMIALHELFSNSGPENLAKFGRKQLLCALGLNDTAKARAVFARLPHAAQNDHLTRFLMFKISLRDWDHQLGCECIEFLGRPTVDGNNQKILYACIREAQEVKDEICTLSALKATVEAWNPEKASAGSLPSMVRCSIRLLVKIEEQERISKGDHPSEEFIDDLCTMFERAADSAKQKPLDRDGKTIFTIPELTWFRKNAYNIGAKYLDAWSLPSIIRVFTACLDYINCFPTDLPKSDRQDLNLMAMRCHFVVAAAHVAIARTTDEVTEQVQRYLQARQHNAALHSRLSAEDITQNRSVVQDLNIKLGTMAVFDFEAAVALKKWDELGQIVRAANIYRDETMLKAMGDCLLRSHAPGKVMFSTMRLIINEIFVLAEFDNEKLSKYIRCVYQVILPLDDDLALQLLDEALRLSREGAQVGRRFPSAELEWLVATSFNHAVDFYARSEEEKCHRWALKAMDLATFMEDGGQYRDLLQEKFSKLRFGATSR